MKNSYTKKSVSHYKKDRLMNLAVATSRLGYQRVGGNPPVGAVIVEDGIILSTGFHGEDGLKHAEIVALEKAKLSREGATLFVTLEPCSHFGKTPPCTDAILDSGISRVFFGRKDLNPVASRGSEILTKKGVSCINLDSLNVENQLYAWETRQTKKKVLVDIWVISSLNGYGFLLDEHPKFFEYFVSLFKKKIASNAQSDFENYSINNPNYHYHCAFDRFIDPCSSKVFRRFHILRIPELVDPKNTDCKKINLGKNVRLISASRIGNCLVECYIEC